MEKERQRGRRRREGEGLAELEGTGWSGWERRKTENKKRDTSMGLTRNLGVCFLRECSFLLKEYYQIFPVNKVSFSFIVEVEALFPCHVYCDSS